LFFRGAGALPFGQQIRSVSALVQHLLTPGLQAAHLEMHPIAA
jgi:hypothetical protein